jgi:hypothetical protein
MLTPKTPHIECDRQITKDGNGQAKKNKEE